MRAEASLKMDIHQEIIKVSARIFHIGHLTKVIPLNLFLDIVPSFFADITCALSGCFHGGSVYVSFRFASKQRKTFNAVGRDVLFDILITSKGPSALGMFRNYTNIREVKHDVYGKRQTAKMKRLPSLFSCVYSRVKLIVFVMNSRRRYSTSVCFIYGLKEKSSK